MVESPYEVCWVFHVDGRVEFKVRGLKGAACKDVAAAIQKATGFAVASDTATGEMFETPVVVSAAVRGKA